MTLTDIIILMIVGISLALIIYFSFIKNKGNKCACCNQKNKNNNLLKQYYKSKCEGNNYKNK